MNLCKLKFNKITLRAKKAVSWLLEDNAILSNEHAKPMLVEEILDLVVSENRATPSYHPLMGFSYDFPIQRAWD